MADDKKSAKTTGKRPVLKTGEFKSAKTAPAIEAPKADALADAPSPAEALRPAAAEPAAAKSPSGKAKATTTGARPAVKTTTSARKAVPDAAAPPRAPRVTSGDAIWVICRECHEEWTADPARAKAQETISCPACEHRAQPPNDDILSQIALYKGMESKNLTLGALFFSVGCLAMVAWTILSANPVRAADFTFFTLPLIVAGLCGLLTLVFLSKHENSKWETYF